MRKLLTGLLIMLCLFAVGCSRNKTDNKDSDVIKIGVFEPMTGANAAGGIMELEGIQLANELYPTVLGKKVELIIVDNKSDKVEAANAATRLVEKDKVNVVLGSWGSSLSMAAGPIVEEAGIPAIALSATNPLVTLGNDYYFRVCFIDPFQGTVMANYAYTNVGARTAAIVQEISNDYSVGLAQYFTESFKKLTGNENAILGVSNYTTGDQDFSAQLITLSQKNPDVIFAPGNYTESALLIKQARELGITIPILGGDTWETPEFLTVGGAAVEGSVLSTFYTTETAMTENSKIFLDAFRAKYGKEPASVAALGFDGYLLVLDAIEKTGSTDPKVIRDQIASTKNFPGAAGTITLDENGDAVKDAVIKVVKDGGFVYSATVSP
ncbi:ABC transporter substrate-binding protein [Parasphaerochaeta coccoides]|uniref:Amino acid/amide ABC transporter substrate-binding protein, HAAT family n=1 Tax=Parasphaerochaeta coccoides (strain ATCC BAA-1237 / DSM 17374 / SPN1) TaxID=760011 RepID=F4GHZ0_PARC1|nr:ABC transporter substrate-binding protein [Parasphaerochaeta coccoides]AEC02103.1 amino acid/amide ABC transporter substrate-binding protein, HAAT family [Parasphaerochaeta coccoides DSM 17374]